MGEAENPMKDAEWEATRKVREDLAFRKVGVDVWMRLTEAQRDEAVRREAGGVDGASYALDCLDCAGLRCDESARARGTGMSAQEFWRTREVRVALAAKVGERYFCCLRTEQVDEAVRREARADGAGVAYARGCLSALAYDLLRVASARDAPSGA